MQLLAAARLRYYRKKSNFSVSELAVYLGVTPADIVAFETMKAEPTMQMYKTLSQLYGVSIDELTVFEK